MSEKQLHHIMRFGKEAQESGTSEVAGKYGIGFKSGSSRLSNYTTVVTRQRGGPLPNICFVSLLNPLCKHSDGSLSTPTIGINVSTHGPHTDHRERWD